MSKVGYFSVHLFLSDPEDETLRNELMIISQGQFLQNPIQSQLLQCCLLTNSDLSLPITSKSLLPINSFLSYNPYDWGYNYYPTVPPRHKACGCYTSQTCGWIMKFTRDGL